MSNYDQMKSGDIKTQYYAKEFEELDNLFSKYGFDYADYLLTLALVSVEKENSVSLNNKKGNKTHTFSRTVYNKNSLEYDTYYGLVTILTHLNDDYNRVINSMAFKKNTEGEKFQNLINVHSFFSNVLGGIKPLYDNLNDEFGMQSIENLFVELYDEVVNEVDEEVEDALYKLKEIEQEE